MYNFRRVVKHNVQPVELATGYHSCDFLCVGCYFGRFLSDSCDSCCRWLLLAAERYECWEWSKSTKRINSHVIKEKRSSAWDGLKALVLGARALAIIIWITKWWVNFSSRLEKYIIRATKNRTTWASYRTSTSACDCRPSCWDTFLAQTSTF